MENVKKSIVSTVKNFFDLSAKNIDGQEVQMSSYRNMKCILVVNVASKWGLTKKNY